MPSLIHLVQAPKKVVRVTTQNDDHLMVDIDLWITQQNLIQMMWDSECQSFH